MTLLQWATPGPDAIVIGGGFYGCVIAIYLARKRQLRRVVLVEQEPALMQRASLQNQARVHNGCHYPRSFVTAYRSRVNLPKFLADWPSVVKRDFTQLYAIARHNSKVTSRQFERFCREIGAHLEPCDLKLRQLFDRRLIEEIYVVQEHAFDAVKLAEWAVAELESCGVEVRLSATVSGLSRVNDRRIGVALRSNDQVEEVATARYVFNCTYSGLNQLGGDFPGTRMPLKHEVTEMALMSMPESLQGVGVTVMDGPFFSLMPFPSRQLHTLSHVRYTPHLHWADARGTNPYALLHDYDRLSRVDRMVRDVSRYVPAVQDARYVESLFEVKTVLAKNEGDDGRPILFERHAELPGCYSVLGGKIDNIYDVLEKLDTEPLGHD